MAELRQAQLQSEGLKPLPHAVEHFNLIAVQIGHASTFMRLQLDEPFSCKDSQGFPDRQPAPPEPLGHLLLANSLPGH